MLLNGKMLILTYTKAILKLLFPQDISMLQCSLQRQTLGPCIDYVIVSGNHITRKRGQYYHDQGINPDLLHPFGLEDCRYIIYVTLEWLQQITNS